VVEAAATLADERGLDDLTLAVVADRLGVRTPSLYNHIDGSDDLRRRLRRSAMGLLRDRVAAATVGRATDDAVAGFARAFRELARDHPGRYAATVPAGVDPDEVSRDEVELLDMVLGILAGYGLTGDDAVDAARFLRSTIHGFVALERAGGFGLPVEVDASFEAIVVRIGMMLRTWAADRPGAVV
jgi:AcrR family transcriptional regulator